MSDEEDRRRFESLALPHVDAAYNLARWLTHNDHDAQDVAQEALVRAMRYMGGFRGDSARAWLLQIVRHTCYSWLKDNRPAEKISLDDADDAWQDIAAPATDEPHSLALRKADRLQINAAIAALPVAFRIAVIPLGSVMSRLARARGLMREALTVPGTRPQLRTVPKPSQVGGKQ
jgi:RNA polymerase sigma-70 factor (ECF subfamily)